MRLVERYDHARGADLFERYGPTLFFGVPTIYVRLLDVEPARARPIGERVRLFVSGSAPLPAHVLEQFREHFGHVILERYGMTEALMIAGNPYCAVRTPGSVGRPLPLVSLRVVNDGGEHCPTGTTGEVIVRGPNVCAGYWNRPEATASAFADGWFHTGDLGDLDDAGYLTLRGRRSDVIISGGFNIYPREIEDFVLEQPGIREAAIVGVADPVRGDVPIAYVVAGVDLDLVALDRTVCAAFASFKRPRAYVRVDALPRTALGKVQKHLLPPWTPAS
jgi:malonyl-CoA/methylmalonyl-CoA synthetase